MVSAALDSYVTHCHLNPFKDVSGWAAVTEWKKAGWDPLSGLRLLTGDGL